MPEFYDLSRAQASVDQVVMEMDLDQELKGLQYLRLAPPTGKMLPPTLMPDRKINEWGLPDERVKPMTHSGPVRYCKAPGYIGDSGDLNKEELERIAAMFCVTIPRSNGAKNQRALRLENIKMEQSTANRHKNILYRARSAIRRRFHRKIHPIY